MIERTAIATDADELDGMPFDNMTNGEARLANSLIRMGLGKEDRQRMFHEGEFCTVTIFRSLIS